MIVFYSLERGWIGGYDFSLKNPHLGQAQVSRQLKANYATDISPNGIRLIWLSEGMNTAGLRIAKLNQLNKTA